MTVTGTGLTRLQHLVLWVADVERSVRFYVDLLAASSRGGDRGGGRGVTWRRDRESS